MYLQVAQHLARVAAAGRQLGGGPQRGSRVAGDHRVNGPEQLLRIRHPQDGQHVGGLDPLCAGVGDELFQGAQRVAEGAGGVAGDQGRGPAVDIDRLSRRHAPDHGSHLLGGRAAEVEAVAAIDHGGQDLLGLGGGQDEDRAWRRLLEGLEEGVPGLLGEHVGFVEDVDLVAPGDRGHLLAQLADVVDRVVGGGVHLDHVERGGAGDRHARVAGAAGADRGAVLAVQAGGQDLGHARLAGAAGADEQVGVVDIAALDGVGQGAHHVLLPHHVGERAGTVAAVERGAGGHERNEFRGVPGLLR